MGYRSGILRHVGVDRPYSTIQAAVDDSETDDSILIDHGVYNESVVINDIINLKGGSPVPGGVRVVAPDDNPAIRISIEGLAGHIYFESIEAENNIGNWQRAIEIVTPVSCEALYVHVNKCRIIATGRRFCIGMGTNPQFNLGGLYITNCYLERGYAHTGYLDYINETVVSGTECNNPFLTYGGDPDYEDTVYVPTVDYGTQYGSLNFRQPIFYFSGHVLENNSPVRRLVRATTRAFNTITTYSGGGVHHTGSAMSDATTGEFTIIGLETGKHSIICEDDDAGLVYRDLIASDISPIHIDT